LLPHHEATGDFLEAPVDRVVMNPPIRGLEDFDRESGPFCKDSELSIEHDHPIRTFYDVLDLEPQIREAPDRAAIELADRGLAPHAPVRPWLSHQHRRAHKYRIVRVMGHEQVQVARIPSFEPVLHQSSLRHYGNLSSML